jgi:hypothetical protein
LINIEKLQFSRANKRGHARHRPSDHHFPESLTSPIILLLDSPLKL